MSAHAVELDTHRAALRFPSLGTHADHVVDLLAEAAEQAELLRKRVAAVDSEEGGARAIWHPTTKDVDRDALQAAITRLGRIRMALETGHVLSTAVKVAEDLKS